MIKRISGLISGALAPIMFCLPAMAGDFTRRTVCLKQDLSKGIIKECGSILSNGSVGIIIGIAACAGACIAALVIIKKKKASGEKDIVEPETPDEEDKDEE